MLQSSDVTESEPGTLPVGEERRPEARIDAQSTRLARLCLQFAVVVLVIALFIMNGAYPIRDWLFWRIGWLWLWTALHSAGCVSVGYLLLSKVFKRTELPTLETTVTSFALGLVAFTVVMYAAGALSMYKTWFAVLLPLSMMAAGAAPLRGFIGERRIAAARDPLLPAGVWVKLAWAAGVVCLLFVYLEALTPEAINFDANWYHLPAAQDYAREGRLVPFYSQYNRNLPHLATFTFTWGFLVPGLNPALRWMMALHLEFACFVWTLAGIAAATRWILGETRHRGTWAAFFLFPIIFVYDSNLGGSADHVLATFAPPALLACARAIPRFEWRSCGLAGALLGGMLLTKYQAVYLLGSLGVVLVVGYAAALFRIRSPEMTRRRAREARRLLIAAGVLVATFAFVVSPHFISNYVFYNNPFYPFLQKVVKGSYPTTPKSALFMTYMFADGGGFVHHEPLYERVLQALRFGLTAPFEPHYSFTHDVPALGALFVLLLPFALFIRGRKRTWLTIAVAYIGAAIWAWTYLADRYLQAIVPLFAAVTAAVMVRAWELSRISRAALVPLVLLQVVWSGDALFYSGGQRFNSAMTMVGTGLDGRVDGRFAYRTEFVHLGESMPSDAVGLYHTERPSLGIDRKLVFDGPRAQAYVYYDDIKGPRALYDYYKRLGITHLIWWSQTSADHSKQAEALFNDFVFRYAEGRKKFAQLNLAAMPKTRPPADSEFLVLTIGTAYKDGLYRLEQLTKQELLPRRRQGRYPKPLQELEAIANAQPLIDQARVVIATTRGAAAKALPPMLKPAFLRGIRYYDHDVFVRRGDPTGGGGAQ